MTKKILINEKIFIAGATGMVGSAICRHFIKMVMEQSMVEKS